MPVLYGPDGRPFETENPTTMVNLKAQGYSEEKPFVPEEHPASEVVAHIEKNPDEAPAIKAAEAAGKGRKSVLDAPVPDATGDDAKVTG